jgi:hypothetical protein
MYIKVINNQIAQYPYTIQDLRNDNPEVLFPHTYPIEVLNQFNCYHVIESAKPVVDITKNVVEGEPVFHGTYAEKTWIVVDATTEEIEYRQQKALQSLESIKLEAYRNESDPIFFKWQRDEATKQEWLDKVAEIKSR